MLITFEGIEGTGKSTQVKLLKDKLTELGRVVKVYGQPGGVPVGLDIREIFKKEYDVEISPTTEMLLLLASFIETDKQIRKDIANGYTVIVDRWVKSMLAYQGGGRGYTDTVHG